MPVFNIRVNLYIVVYRDYLYIFEGGNKLTEWQFEENHRDQNIEDAYQFINRWSNYEPLPLPNSRRSINTFLQFTDDFH